MKSVVESFIVFFEQKKTLIAIQKNAYICNCVFFYCKNECLLQYLNNKQHTISWNQKIIIKLSILH